MKRVLQEDTYPVFPSSVTASRVDQVSSWEPEGKGPGLYPGEDTNQCPGRRGLMRQGLGESQTRLHGTQMPGRQVGCPVTVVEHQVPGQEHAATHELLGRQAFAPAAQVHTGGL